MKDCRATACATKGMNFLRVKLKRHHSKCLLGISNCLVEGISSCEAQQRLCSCGCPYGVLLPKHHATPYCSTRRAAFQSAHVHTKGALFSLGLASHRDHEARI